MSKTFELIKRAEKKKSINYMSTTTGGGLQDNITVKKAYRRQKQIELFRKKQKSHSYSKKRIKMADYMLLRSQIKRYIDAKNIRSILITSAVEGEGKTFTAFNLALSFAMLPNKQVFLIEANLRKPFLGSLLALPTECMGLIDYLQYNIPLEELMIDPGIPNLKILPAGIQIPEAAELLATDKMGEIIDRLLQAHDDAIILLDGSSLLRYPDALILMEAVQSVLLILKAEKTSIKKVKEAHEKVEGKKLIGVVLNMVEDQA